MFFFFDKTYRNWQLQALSQLSIKVLGQLAAIVKNLLIKTPK